MGNKRKGQLTTDSEWHKHLRKIGKRFFWKGERNAEKKMVNENLSEINDMTEIPSLTFDELFDLIEENRFENPTDKKIAEKIFEAERDWKITSQESLNDFIIVLETETGGTVTKTSLKKLLKKYNRKDTQYGWEAESVCSLLEIFELTKETDLRNIFRQLAEDKVT
ncbi:hypothetical protein [Psychroserpens sp. NJDZ02]|uniref:hypothetical protein n=1 Tax=Psychroserpens sp. NJDZ02 TaxID=2570561 RepID=UPI0010A856BF|nr:hypothetical protein [Psychroserpens sp. NJDZ02]QCE39912.1 hypothetical protein E9099_00175 [Psychroserpens sp. NJDZ02]